MGVALGAGVAGALLRGSASFCSEACRLGPEDRHRLEGEPLDQQLPDRSDRGGGDRRCSADRRHGMVLCDEGCWEPGWPWMGGVMVLNYGVGMAAMGDCSVFAAVGAPGPAPLGLNADRCLRRDRDPGRAAQRRRPSRSKGSRAAGATRAGEPPAAGTVSPRCRARFTLGSSRRSAWSSAGIRGAPAPCGPGSDIAALAWFRAFGHSPPGAVLVMAYVPRWAAWRTCR